MNAPESEPRIVVGTRNGRYGEVLLAFLEDGLRLEVYNSYLLNDGPEELPQGLWDALSPEAIANEHGAAVAILNGPRHWLMDGIGKVDVIEPFLRDFGGIQMRRVATIELDGPLERAPYREVQVNRGAIWFFDAGTEVFELISPEGRRYVMQAYCTGVDHSLTVESLGSLAERLTMPEGWRFESWILDRALKIDTTGAPATVLQDELQNTYTYIQ